jgi:hypothetical protein
MNAWMTAGPECLTITLSKIRQKVGLGFFPIRL